MDHYRVCVVGAGTAGLGVVKQLLRDENIPISDIILLDESTGVGGVWNGVDRDIDHVNVGMDCSGNPIYDDLHTNLPKDFMSFSDFRYPIESNHFPSHRAVLKYLQTYSQTFIPDHCIQLNTSVKDIQKTNDHWTVKCCINGELSANRVQSFTTEYVVVCTGHYRYPFVPFFKESARANSRIHSMHSSAFRHPSAFTSYRNILVVGSRASAKDVCMLLLKHCQSNALGQNIYMAVRGGMENMILSRRAFVLPVMKQGGHVRGEVQYIDHQAGEVTFSSAVDSPQPTLPPDYVKESIDLIIYATGYLYKYPFLAEDQHSGPSMVRERPLLHRVVSLADPTLMFVGTLNFLLSPGIVLEYQARYVAQLISGKIQLPRDFTSLLNKFVVANVTSSRGVFKEKDAGSQKCILVDQESVELAEFDMSSSLMFSSPTYCNKLARLTNSQGFWSQLFQQRLWWTVTSLLYQFTCSISPRFRDWLRRNA